MASRDGATVDGTDGSDFGHRERVVAQYHTRSEEAGEGAENAAAAPAADLPMTGDYAGIGGPDSVPLESDGAFEKPPSLGNGYTFLNDLFMAPTDEAIKTFQTTELKRLIARNKGRLSTTLWCHILVTIVLVVKLSPAILDYLDIFVLQLEELDIPKPLLWEWIWLGGSLLTVLSGAHAIKASKVVKIQIFMGIVFTLGVFPVLYAMAVHYSDFYAYAFDKQSKVYQTWKKLPIAVLWYAFCIMALNVHFFELGLAFSLKNAWNLKRKKA